MVPRIHWPAGDRLGAPFAGAAPEWFADIKIIHILTCRFSNMGASQLFSTDIMLVMSCYVKSILAASPQLLRDVPIDFSFGLPFTPFQVHI